VNAKEKTEVHLGLEVHGSVAQALVWGRKSLSASYGDLLWVSDTSSGEVVALVQEALVGRKGEGGVG